MPRKRMVQPSFWTEIPVLACSPYARLLCLGMWNFCDDQGIHPVSYKALKAEVFPGDDCSIDDIKKWVGELISTGLLREYTVGDKHFWIVNNWNYRQTINRPTPSPYPLPESGYKQISQGIAITEHSVSVNGGLTEHSLSIHRGLIPNIIERKEREEKGKEEDIVVSDANSIHPQCPQEEIKELYHSILPMCRQIRVWNESRARLLRARWKEDKKHQSLEFWKWYFGHVKESKFLTGQVAGRDGRPPFSVDLEWLTKPTNFAKVIEGKFHE